MAVGSRCIDHGSEHEHGRGIFCRRERFLRSRDFRCLLFLVGRPLFVEIPGNCSGSHHGSGLDNILGEDCAKQGNKGSHTKQGSGILGQIVAYGSNCVLGPSAKVLHRLGDILANASGRVLGSVAKILNRLGNIFADSSGHFHGLAGQRLQGRAEAVRLQNAENGHYVPRACVFLGVLELGRETDFFV